MRFSLRETIWFMTLIAFVAWLGTVVQPGVIIADLVIVGVLFAVYRRTPKRAFWLLMLVLLILAMWAYLEYVSRQHSISRAIHFRSRFSRTTQTLFVSAEPSGIADQPLGTRS
jgi:hypothetical protein